MGIKYINAPCEAEHYCSLLVIKGFVDAVVSEDMDTIACGAPIVLREFSNKEDYIYEYNLTKILINLDITLSELIDICILCGNDYISRIRGVNHIRPGSGKNRY